MFLQYRLGGALVGGRLGANKQDHSRARHDPIEGRQSASPTQEAEYDPDDDRGDDCFVVSDIDDGDDVEGLEKFDREDASNYELPAEYETYLQCRIKDEDRNRIRQLLQADAGPSTLGLPCWPELTTAPFKYRPLDADASDAMRLAVLWPVPPNERAVECSLIHVCLDNTLPYFALSYTWGDSTDPKRSIYVDGHHVRVTRSLYSALFRMRGETNLVLLWIDALCIDQENPDEVSSQVLFMREIYSHAERVVIWLGREADGSDFAIWWLSRSDPSLAFTHLSPRALYALREFLTRAWFERIWIIQEFILGKAPLFVCGKYCFSSDTFLSGLDLLERNLSFRKRISKAIQVINFSIRPIRQLFYYRSAIERPTILEVLHSYRHFRATKPQDKIYGLLGLCDLRDKRRDAIPTPDYEKPYQDVYREWTIHFIEESDNLDVLYACVKTRDPRDPLIPSWGSQTGL